MNRLAMSTTILSVALTWAGSAAAQQQGSKPQDAKSKQGSQSSINSMDRVRIVEAKELVGKDVRSSDGKELGEIEYLLIGAADGKVRYGVIEPDGELERSMRGKKAELVAIPWNALQANIDRGHVELSTTFDKARRAPTLSEDALEELMKPAMITRIDEFWTPIVETAPSAQGSKDKAGKTASKDSRNAENRNARDVDLLVSRSAVTTLLPPAATTAKNLSGTELESTDGKEVGEIESVAIDLDRGRVAYVLIGRGGFLGMGEELLPVPFELIELTGEGPMKLGISADRLQKMPAFASSSFPRSVRQSDLKRVYDQYGITPYWNSKPADRSTERASKDR